MEKNKKDGVIERWQRAIRQNVGVPLEDKIINPFADNIGNTTRIVQKMLGVESAPPTKKSGLEYTEMPKKAPLNAPGPSGDDDLARQRAEAFRQFREQQRMRPRYVMPESEEEREAAKMRINEVWQRFQEQYKREEEQKMAERERLRQEALQEISQQDMEMLRRALDELDKGR